MVEALRSAAEMNSCVPQRSSTPCRPLRVFAVSGCIVGLAVPGLAVVSTRSCCRIKGVRQPRSLRSPSRVRVPCDAGLSGFEAEGGRGLLERPHSGRPAQIRVPPPGGRFAEWYSLKGSVKSVLPCLLFLVHGCTSSHSPAQTRLWTPRNRVPRSDRP